MKINFKIISVFLGILSLCLTIYCFNLSYGKTLINEHDNSEFPRLNIQDSLINLQNYYWGNDIVTNLEGKCIQGFIGWLKQWKDEDYDIEVFNYPNVTYTVKVNSDTTISSQQDEIDKTKAKYNEYAFNYYPTYQCCDITSLLKDNKVMIMMSIKMTEVGRTMCQLSALVPQSIKESGKSNNLEKEYYNLHFYYEFWLEVKTRPNDKQSNIDARIEDLYERLKWYHRPSTNNPRDLRDCTGIYRDNFDWKLTNIKSYPPELVTFKLNDLPTDIFEVFKKK